MLINLHHWSERDVFLKSQRWEVSIVTPVTMFKICKLNQFQYRRWWHCCYSHRTLAPTHLNQLSTLLGYKLNTVCDARYISEVVLINESICPEYRSSGDIGGKMISVQDGRPGARECAAASNCFSKFKYLNLELVGHFSNGRL